MQLFCDILLGTPLNEIHPSDAGQQGMFLLAQQAPFFLLPDFSPPG
jgi:hypothetical protein